MFVWEIAVELSWRKKRREKTIVEILEALATKPKVKLVKAYPLDRSPSTKLSKLCQSQSTETGGFGNGAEGILAASK